MNQLRISLGLLMLGMLAACGGSSSPTAPPNPPTTQNQAALEVTTATYRALADAFAGISSNIDEDRGLDNGEFLDQTGFDAVATAEAAAGLIPNGASAEALVDVSGIATWPSPGGARQPLLRGRRQSRSRGRRPLHQFVRRNRRR